MTAIRRRREDISARPLLRAGLTTPGGAAMSGGCRYSPRKSACCITQSKSCCPPAFLVATSELAAAIPGWRRSLASLPLTSLLAFHLAVRWRRPAVAMPSCRAADFLAGAAVAGAVCGAGPGCCANGLGFWLAGAGACCAGDGWRAAQLMLLVLRRFWRCQREPGFCGRCRRRAAGFPPPATGFVDACCYCAETGHRQKLKWLSSSNKPGGWRLSMSAYLSVGCKPRSALAVLLCCGLPLRARFGWRLPLPPSRLCFPQE